MNCECVPYVYTSCFRLPGPLTNTNTRIGADYRRSQSFFQCIVTFVDLLTLGRIAVVFFLALLLDLLR